MHKSLAAAALLLAIIATAASAQLDEVATHAQSFENGQTNLLQLKVLLNSARDKLTRSVENELIALDPKDENFRGWPKDAAQRILGEPTRQEHWIWIENRQESQYTVEPQPMWDRILFAGKKIQLHAKAHPNAIEQDGKLLPFYWIDFQIQLNQNQPKVDLLAALEQFRVMLSLYKQTGQGLNDIAKKAVELERSLQYHDVSATACEAAMTETLGQKLLPEERLRWRGTLHQSQKGGTWLVVDDKPEKQWRELNPRVDFNVNFPYTSAPLTREQFETRTASELIELWRESIKALQNGPADPSFNQHVETINIIGNVLNEKANRNDDQFTTQQWETELTNTFNTYTTDFSKTLLREKNIHIPLFSLNKTRSNTYCQTEHQNCPERNRCQAAQCVFDPTTEQNQPQENPTYQPLEPASPAIETPQTAPIETNQTPTETPTEGVQTPNDTPDANTSENTPIATPEPSINQTIETTPDANLSKYKPFTGFLTNEPELPQCHANEVLDATTRNCNCLEGFNNCDGDWINGCETTTRCSECKTDADCAPARCDGDRDVVRFTCRTGEPHEEQAAAAEFGAFCRQGIQRDEFGAWVSAWGEGFENFEKLKQQAWQEAEPNWCRQEFETAKMQRLALQESANDAFLQWFFTEFVQANSRDFETHGRSVHSAFDAIQQVNEELARSMGCLNMQKLPDEFKPIRLSFQTPQGDVQIWEEIKTHKKFGNGKTPVLTPYMKEWIFPTKEQFKQLFTEKVKENFVGPTPSEIQEIRRDQDAMTRIRRIADAFGGEARILLEVKDRDQVVLRNLNTINERDVMKVAYAQPGQQANASVTLLIEYDFLYRMIETIIKDLEGHRIQSPWWEEQNDQRELNEDLIPIRIFFGLVTGIFNGDIQIQPLTQAPAVFSVISELMQIVPKQ